MTPAAARPVSVSKLVARAPSARMVFKQFAREIGAPLDELLELRFDEFVARLREARHR